MDMKTDLASTPGAGFNLQALADEVAAEAPVLAAEAMGWRPLADGAYFHPAPQSTPASEAVVHVVGLPDLHLTAENVLLLAG